MRTKTMYATLDTETLGGAANPLGIYDLGIIIHDNTGKVFDSVHILINEFFSKIDEAYYKKNLPLYQKMIENNEVIFVDTERDAIVFADKFLSMYGVKYVMAYNTSFDLIKTRCRTLIENREFIDIFKMAKEVLYHTTKYQNYCYDNNFLTKQQQPKCNVETVYGFMVNNEDFEEEHTALSDACQEMEIFVWLYGKHKPYTKNCHEIQF